MITDRSNLWIINLDPHKSNLQFKNKPLDELARALPSFKWPLLSVDVMVGMYDNIEHRTV